MSFYYSSWSDDYESDYPSRRWSDDYYYESHQWSDDPYGSSQWYRSGTYSGDRGLAGESTPVTDDNWRSEVLDILSDLQAKLAKWGEEWKVSREESRKSMEKVRDFTEKLEKPMEETRKENTMSFQEFKEKLEGLGKKKSKICEEEQVGEEVITTSDMVVDLVVTEDGDEGNMEKGKLEEAIQHEKDGVPTKEGERDNRKDEKKMGQNEAPTGIKFCGEPDIFAGVDGGENLIAHEISRNLTRKYEGRWPKMRVSDDDVITGCGHGGDKLGGYGVDFKFGKREDWKPGCEYGGDLNLGLGYGGGFKGGGCHGGRAAGGGGFRGGGTHGGCSGGGSLTSLSGVSEGVCAVFFGFEGGFKGGSYCGGGVEGSKGGKGVLVRGLKLAEEDKDFLDLLSKWEGILVRLNEGVITHFTAVLILPGGLGPQTEICYSRDLSCHFSISNLLFSNPSKTGPTYLFFDDVNSIAITPLTTLNSKNNGPKLSLLTFQPNIQPIKQMLNYLYHNPFTLQPAQTTNHFSTILSLPTQFNTIHHLTPQCPVLLTSVISQFHHGSKLEEGTHVLYTFQQPQRSMSDKLGGNNTLLVVQAVIVGSPHMGFQATQDSRSGEYYTGDETIGCDEAVRFVLFKFPLMIMEDDHYPP